ncbi:4-hydroxy-3-methylbut-2-enyl diphosphate reductase [Allonocardiopsis opalescens]|uniref:4-hydroxy-3-methylbut-2-enyl diphosphate reductase n=1 Tax=Allonocardiopsis opalescens TaxID=1144618 RepID=A0A2T0Q9V2_9ACTN|nr:4-hydroxy-3-methylbut-2-enyl diphosphate reductase [Allonocardiopsis opalescens]PRY00581.1 4-hydroxy-3-methylbut-2-enyl diphosphate reductase [Allonocardiopsis opalescens]
MSATAAHRLVAAIAPDALAPGTVLVADTLAADPRAAGPGGGADVPCPAAPLVEAELRRLGTATVRGVLRLAPAGTDPVSRDSAAVAALLRGGGAGVGIGVAAPPDDHAARLAARAALASWLAVAGSPRTVLLAAPRSFCAGVERAIEVVEHALRQRGAPVYVRKQIVHNTHVVGELSERGAVFVDELESVPEGATVVFSAHGVSPQVRTEAERRRLRVIDATCPLVTKVHVEARRFAGRGDTVVLIGHAGHEEVEGTLGEAPEHTVLVETVADVERLEVADPERVSYLTQTTLAVDEAAEVVDALRRRFPALRGPGSDDICYATTNRQDALAAIAEEAQLVLVVGSASSSNSRRLVELSQRRGTAAHLIEDAAAIRPDWLAGVRTVGLTAGASAPPRLVEEVIAILGGLGPVRAVERETARETVRFTLPSALRGPG